jgi:sodium/potassium/calcium exchanger 6
MLNILLGIGLGGAWQAIQAANKKHSKHPDRPFQYKPYHIQVGGTLIVSAVVLLVTLMVLLIVVPMNKWMMTRKIGWGLVALWGVGTAANLVIEITGMWRDIA